MRSETRPAAIIGGNRIPFARQNGPYADAGNQDMLTTVLDGLVSRFSIQGERLGEVAAGAVLKHSRDFNLTREAVLGSALSPWTPAYDVQQACATSLETTIHVANKIALGQIEAGIAAGVDTTSDAPLEINDDLRRILLDMNAAKSPAEIARIATRIRPSMIVPEIPRNQEPRTGLSMGEHAAITAERWEVSRAEQDEFALQSHRNLAQAYDRGFYDDLVTPYLGLDRDQNLRPDVDIEKLGKLPVVFGDEETGTMTPGNSTPLSDGAASVLLATEEWAAERNLDVMAYLRDAEAAAVDFVHGDEGLLMAPAYAVPRLLARNGLGLEDFDHYEFHEAFASTVLATFKAWEDPDFCKERLGLDGPLGSIDHDKLNIRGSSLAAGHPFAATGARIVATAAKVLAEAGEGRALISICAAGGNGVVAILER
jgi:acetyl-CoA C-acetyltransferase